MMRLRESVRLFAPSETTDRFGNVRRGHKFEARRRCMIQERVAGEASEAGALREQVKSTMTLRVDQKTRQITPLWYAEARGAKWGIVGVIQKDSQGRWMELTIERGVAL